MKNLNFKLISLILIISFNFVSCKNSDDSKDNSDIKKQDNQVNVSKEKIDFLYDFEGKYPFEIDLLNNEILKDRLTKLLGDKYQFIVDIWDVQTPIAIVNGIFYAWGMQEHSGGDPGATILADIEKNIIYVIITENGEEFHFSEDGKEIPDEILELAVSDN